MDKRLHRESIEYEKLTQSIYQAILKSESIENISVEHNVGVKGKSGVTHQIDVLWHFKLANIEHTVLVECKNYATNITLEKVRNFHSVLDDIGNARGLIVTKTGFQSGASEFAQFNGIGLKVLRKPTELDWEGRIKEIHVKITAKSLVNSEDKPLRVLVQLKAKDEIQQKMLERLEKTGRLKMPSTNDLRFFDQNGQVCVEELNSWLTPQLDVMNKDEGGPYLQKFSLIDKYILINEADEDEVLVQVSEIEASYFVESIVEEFISDGEAIVDAILKDFITDNIEYVKKSH